MADTTCPATRMAMFYVVGVAMLVCGALVLLALSITFYNKEADEPPARGKMGKGDILAICALGALLLVLLFVSLQGGSTDRGACGTAFMTLFYVVLVVGVVGIAVMSVVYGVVFMRDSSNTTRQNRGKMLLTAALVLVILLVTAVAYQAAPISA